MLANILRVRAIYSEDKIENNVIVKEVVVICKGNASNLNLKFVR